MRQDIVELLDNLPKLKQCVMACVSDEESDDKKNRIAEHMITRYYSKK